jgi:F-type H+-transporting ATPase subunit gamma
MRDIKTRIKSVKNTQQITKAMNLVSASKLQKAKNRMVATRPFYDETRATIAAIVNSSPDIDHPYIDIREVKRSLTIVISGDLGLCGGYNTNVCAAAMALLKSKDTPMSFLTVGSKARDYFKRRGLTIEKAVTHVSEKPYLDGAAIIGRLARELYDRGEYDEIYIVYTLYHSTISHEPTTLRILPVDTEQFKNKKEYDAEEEKFNLVKSTAEPLMKYEPNDKEVLNAIIPQYVNTVIYGALLESATCEQGARMTAMDSATENAYDMIDKLTISYNRARQGAITQEISEIVGGANALK